MKVNIKITHRAPFYQSPKSINIQNIQFRDGIAPEVVWESTDGVNMSLPEDTQEPIYVSCHWDAPERLLVARSRVHGHILVAQWGGEETELC